MSVVYFFTSGLAYFAGASLVVAAVLLSLLRRTGPRLAGVTALALSGFALMYLSSTPTAAALHVAWFIVVASWLGMYGGLRDSRGAVGTMGRVVVAGLSVAAIALELPYRQAPDWSAGGFEQLYVVGDSLSAGLGGEATWPEMLASEHGIDVTNLAVAGATVGSALRQVDGIVDRRCVVLVEIGGNDMLSGSAAEGFSRDLDALLAGVVGRERAVVMCELPLLPLSDEYGAIQRRIARANGVALIPKRYLARVLTVEGSTTDGLHLSANGHRLMANTVWEVVGGLFEG